MCIIKLRKKDFKNRDYIFLFNQKKIQLYDKYFKKDYDYLIESNEEFLPSIYIEKQLYPVFQRIISITIHIKNKRDSILFYSKEKETNQIEILFESSGVRNYSVEKLTREQYLTKDIPLNTIHYPTTETGGDGNRCILKELMHELELYPQFIRARLCYQFFDYEDIYNLPDKVDELKDICFHFCIRRNSENPFFDMRKSKNKQETANEMVNDKYRDKVSLAFDDNKSLIITNGNHRICFLKRFHKYFKINKIQICEDIEGDYFKTTLSLIRQLERIEDQHKKYYHQTNLTSYNIMESYKKELEIFGLSADEGHTILEEGYTAEDIYNLLKRKDEDKFNKIIIKYHNLLK